MLKLVFTAQRCTVGCLQHSDALPQHKIERTFPTVIELPGKEATLSRGRDQKLNRLIKQQETLDLPALLIPGLGADKALRHCLPRGPCAQRYHSKS